MDLDPDIRATRHLGRQQPRVYRYCIALACGDETVARTATEEAFRAVTERGEDDPAALFTHARAAVKAGLRQRGTADTLPADDGARALFAARPLLEEHHWSLLALVLPEYADRPRHRQIDLTAAAAALGKKLDVTRKAVDRLVEPGGYLDVALFTADAADSGAAGCPDLAAVLAAAKRPRPALRKAVAAHLPGCAACTAALRARPRALAVLSAVPVPPLPEEPDEPVTAAEDGATAVAADEPSAPEPHHHTDHTDHADDTDDTDDTDDDITVELLLAAPPEHDHEPAEPEHEPEQERPLAAVYYVAPAVQTVRLPLLRRPPVLLSILVVFLAVAAVAGILGLRSGSPTGLRGAAAGASAAGTPATAPSPAPVPPGIAVTGSAGATRTPAASTHAKASNGPSAVPTGSVSAGLAAPVAPGGDRLREMLPLLVQPPGCPGQTFGGSCYSVQPFTVQLSVTVPAGVDEDRLAGALQWTVRAPTLLGPVAFHGQGNHARVTVTDAGQATPPTVWTMQATLTIDGETHLSNEVTLRVYATTT